MPITMPPRPEVANAGLAGLYDVRDRADYEEMARFRNLQAGAETQLTLEDLVQGAPVRAAERQGKIEREPFLTDIQRQNARQLGLTNVFTEQTQPGRIAATNAQSQTAVGAEQLEQMHQALTVLDALSQVPQSPIAPQQIGQILQSVPGAQNNPALIEALRRVQNPQQIPAIAERLRNYLKDYRMTMDKTRMQGEYDLEGRRITGAAAARTAGISAKGKVKTPVEVFDEETNPMNKYAAAVGIVNDPKQSAEDRARAGKYMQETEQMVQTLLQRGASPLIPNFPQPAPVQMPSPQGAGAPQPSPGPRPTMRWNPQTRKLEPIQ